MKNKLLVFFGILLIVLAILSLNVQATAINNVVVDFEKDTYTTLYGTSLKINYKITNNNNENLNVLVYTVCSDDVLSCNLSRVFNLNAKLSITSSFIVNTEDYGTSNIKFYVKEMKTNNIRNYNLTVYVDRYNDDGRFEVDLSSRSFCKNQTKEVILTFDRVFYNDVYNLELSSDTLYANIKGEKSRYLYRDLEIPIHIDTRNVDSGFHKLRLTISNDDVFINKEFSIYVSDCPDPVVYDFSVTGVLSQTHILKKEEPLVLNFVVKNISRHNKHLFISQESDDVLDISFSNRELRLAPNESKEVSITFYALKEIKSGNYPVKLLFFDEKATISRNLVFLVQPISNLEVRIVHPSILLEIGKSFDVGVLIENKGDLKETVYLDLVLSNDLRYNNPIDKVILNPNTSRTVLLNISAGNQTVEKASNIYLRMYNQSRSFEESYTINVNAIRPRELLKINFLSFPDKISISMNSLKEFSFEVYNFDDRDISISRIDITGLPQDINYEVTQHTFIPRNQTKTINGYFSVDQVPLGEYTATFIFYSSTGAVVSKNVILNITDELVEYDDSEREDTYPITGFFTFARSALLGFIFLCLLLIILFSTGVIKTKHKTYSKEKVYSKN